MPLLHRLPFLGLAALLAFGCAPHPTAMAPKPPVDIGRKAYVYSRWDQGDCVRLRIAMRTFKPKNGIGPSVTLAGAIHIGEAAYYQALQRQFDAASVVLFEGVGRRQSGPTEYPKPDQNHGSTGYRALAHALNLVCQDEVINYHRPNFRRADLNWEDLMARLNAEIANGQPQANAGDGDNPGTPKSGATPAPSAAMVAGQNAAQAKKQLEFIGGVVGGQNSLLGAGLFLLKMSPAARGATRLTLATKSTESANGGSLAAGGNGMISPRLEKLILTERNEAAMRELGKILHAPPAADSPQNISVFYGAAHLPGMEKILRERFGYVPVESVWLTALTVHPVAEEVPADMLRDLRPAQKN